MDSPVRKEGVSSGVRQDGGEAGAGGNDVIGERKGLST